MNKQDEVLFPVGPVGLRQRSTRNPKEVVAILDRLRQHDDLCPSDQRGSEFVPSHAASRSSFKVQKGEDIPLPLWYTHAVVYMRGGREGGGVSNRPPKRPRARFIRITSTFFTSAHNSRVTMSCQTRSSPSSTCVPAYRTKPDHRRHSRGGRTCTAEYCTC